MRDIYLGAKFAISYFTSIPVRFASDDDLSSRVVLSYLLSFLPATAILTASVTLLLYIILAPLGLFGAMVSASFYMILTGFLHSEAVMDVADATYAAHSGKDAYSVIKEPTVGAMGVLWGVVALLLKLSAISYFLLHHLWVWLVVVLIISRLGLLLLIYTQKARSSFIETLATSLSLGRLLSILLLYSLLLYLLTGSLYCLALIVLGFAVSLLSVKLLRRAVGFVNGDVLGSVLEVVEIVLFVVVARVYI